MIEGDIKGCFDNIDHHLLLEAVRKLVIDKKIIRLLRAFLKAGIMLDGQFQASGKGSPQGGIISPLLANIMLTALDQRYDRWTPSTRETANAAGQRRLRDQKKGLPTFLHIRYADDFAILATGTREEAEAEKHRLTEFLHDSLHLELSAEKTLITRIEEGFSFLGYRVVLEASRKTGKPLGKLYIPKDRVQRLRNQIKQVTNRSTVCLPLETLLRKKLNPLILGWRGFYRYATGAYKVFHGMDQWIWRRIRIWLGKKYGRRNLKWITRRFECRIGGRTRWTDNGEVLQLLTGNRTAHYPTRGYSIRNEWE